jgi:tetratricopeptide (TPR) repeat protein
VARLDVIGETEFTGDGVLLLPLAEAYQKLRNSDQAIALYRTHVATLDEPYQAEIWRIIAQLSVDWFDYEQGVEAYENIQNLNALTIPDREQFAKLYEKLGNRTQAIAVQQQLAPLYYQDETFNKLANVYLKLAENYYELGQYENAILYNESAFGLAWELKQFVPAEAALNNLAQVYVAKDNIDFAILVYEQLLIVQNTSYNRFGMMETYDHLGKLYQQKPLYPEALISYQKGLAIAKELNHNISLFTQAIETLTFDEIPIQ